MNSVTAKLRQYLNGTWQLSRDISGSHIAHATGLAMFEKTNEFNELKYSEDVEITLSEGKTLNGYQHYIYRFQDDNKVDVYFADGVRLFHSLECSALDNKPEHQATHYCQPDTYTTSYFFYDTMFQIEHRVNGPKKDYISRTTYTKID